MRNLVLAIALVAILAATSGCRGHLRQMLRGAPCNTCNPQFAAGQQSIVGGCNTGTCGTGVCSAEAVQPTRNGILSGIFGGQQNATSATLPPASIPASNFDAAPPTIGNNTDLYGNTNSVGRIELPPSSPFN